jgi:hypothetical protein
MTVVQTTNELTLASEALRAQATGQLPVVTPRGLALFLAAGLPDWMKAWSSLVPATPKIHARPAERETTARFWKRRGVFAG